jgi:hypothetical protein
MISINEVRKIVPDPKAGVDETVIAQLMDEIDAKIEAEAHKGNTRACSRQVKQAVGEILVERYAAGGYNARILGNHTVEISW